jgi:hypothetical protein
LVNTYIDTWSWDSVVGITTGYGLDNRGVEVNIYIHIGSWDSVVGIATGYRLGDRGVGVRVSVGSRISLLYIVQTGSLVHPTSYPIEIGGLLPRG